MTVIHHHIDGTASSAAREPFVKNARTIDPEWRARHEGYLAEILGALAWISTRLAPRTRRAASCRR